MEGKRGSDATSRSASALAIVQRVEIELGHEHVFRAGKPRASAIAGDELADDAESARVVRAHLGGAAAARGIRCRPGRELGLDADGLADVPRRCPWRRRSRRSATEPTSAVRPRRRTRRTRPRVLRRRREAAAGFEQADVLPLAAAVVRAGVDQPRQERRPEDGEFLRERVGDGGCLHARLAERRARVLLDETRTSPTPRTRRPSGPAG